MKGGLELLLVGIVLLAIFGPKTLQSLARNAGRSAGQANKLKDKVVSDLSIDDVKKGIDTLSKVPRSPQDVARLLLSSDEKKKETAKAPASETKAAS